MRRSAVLLGGALVLGVLFGLTEGWGRWEAAGLGPEAVEREQAETVEEVRAAFDALLGEMRQRAEAVATLPAVREALADGAERPQDDVLAALAGRGDVDRVAVEVFTASGDLIAWDGPAFPHIRQVPDSLTTRVVVDEGDRVAIALWSPVASDSAHLGAVRVVHLVQASVPIRNQYLQDVDVADAWRVRIDRPFDVRFSMAPADSAQALRGPDGRTLGRVAVAASSVGTLAAQRARATEAVSAFWLVLLLGWGLAGLGGWVAVEIRRAGVLNVRRAWLRAGGALLALLAALVATRYGLLALDVPVRWLDTARQPAALFDPALLASDLGWGALRSPGDLALSALVLLLGAGLVLVYALRYAAAASESGERSPVRLALGLAAVAAVTAASGWGAALWVRRSVLDATIPYTDRATPLLDGPTLVVVGGLVAVLAASVAAVAAAVLIARAAWRRPGIAGWIVPVGVSVASVAALAALKPDVPLGPLAALTLAAGALAVVLVGRPQRWVWPLTFRGVLVGTLVFAPTLYGLMRAPLEERTVTLLGDAAFAFAEARDDRVTFAVDQVLTDARTEDALRPVLLDAVAEADSARFTGRLDSTRLEIDAVAASLVRSSLLGSLADVATELRFMSPSGDTHGSYVEGGVPARRADDPLGYETMRERFEARGERSQLRRREPVPDRRGLFRTAALGPLLGNDAEVVAWVYLLATPRTVRFAAETPFPRVLAGTGLFGLDDESLSYAEYDDGVRVRSRGAAPLRLDSTIYDRLSGTVRSLRRTEVLGDQRVMAYYERIGDDARDVVSVRAPSDDRLDVLSVLLRLSLGGLVTGALLFGLGVYVRREAGLLPARRTRFRDRVLNRFLFVGLASVVLTGVVGQRVIVEQNRQSVRDALQQRLARAEAALVAEGRGLDAGAGARLDLVASGLGTDIHLYRGDRLEASSRRQLVRQRLIETRLPGPVYRALFLDDQPYAFAEDRLGTFAYTTGYTVLPDSLGRPAGALAIPTLSEQAAIEAGQARMVGYLFGGLLALMAAILVIAVVLAGQLTRPFGRLREGLRAAGAGEAEEPIPVETQDEVGELVESFNAMQAALAESRRQLAEQERELAWSTMARQVAHEIKNPLMPMKLSVQHLQRTFRAPSDEAPPEAVRFAGQFERTTDMLIDQIETLSRIASDFSRFASLPMRSPETVDLGEVTREAAALFEGPLAESGRAELEVDLADGPLLVLADREELRRVFVYLLPNALQAMPERPRPGRITLRTRLGAGEAVAEVEDDGTGIPAEARDQVFQPSFSTKTSGMGLGLAISKRAVEAAGGTIAFETEEGEGTTFTVRLPLAPAGQGDGAPPRAPEAANETGAASV
ncbi:MAG: HAMP domain-containing sensor histidine kinase [Bacteroidota bacterium]